ncbi:MAG: bifunctional hydroxymethylpyrimidine kinase/phosphomethylpyrimidine kinase [Thermodesulfobacteriota bacterium]
MKRILTIAGSDSGGGAGIQADLRTIALLGGFGMSVITALTAQNTLGVQDIYPIPPEFIGKQIDSVIADIGVDAVKTGMLVNSQIVNVVARKIEEYRIEKLIVDPVIIAKGGETLLSKDALDALVEKLIPLAFLITPNLHEASVVCRKPVENLDEMREAAKNIYQKGAKNVLIKGGHLPGMPVDILFDGRNFHEYDSERIDSENTHGTGCVYSAALAFEIAKGKHIYQAVKNAKEFVTSAIRNSFSLGGGHGPVNPYALFSKDIQRYHVISQVKEAIGLLKEDKIGHLIPEVQSNLGMALPYAEKIEDIAALPGRIIRFGDTVKTVSDPEFGASQHIAQIILAVMRYQGDMRSAMNIKYTVDIIEKCSNIGLRVRYFDRRREPDHVKEVEGSSLEWVVENSLKQEKGIPDVIYDTGDVGKEPMVRILGKDAMEVVGKVLKIAKQPACHIGGKSD